MTLSFYNRFHKKSKTFHTILKKNDYTYSTIIFFIHKYIKKKFYILDIGCGVGAIDFYLANYGCKVLGVDISNKAIKIANESLKSINLDKKYKTNVKFKLYNFPLKYPNIRFDAIICSEVLEHLDSDVLAVNKMYNLLNKNGILIASSPSQNSPLFKLGLLKDFDTKVGHLRRYNINNFKNLFVKSGFKDLEIKKVEGFLRNLLFTTKVGGQLLRIINKYPLSKIFDYIDNLTIPLFGESDIYIIAKKV